MRKLVIRIAILALFAVAISGQQSIFPPPSSSATPTYISLWSSATPQTNSYTQVTPTGSYTTPIILPDTTGTEGSMGEFAQFSIMLQK